MKLPGKVVLVTGASRGIGRALSTELARSGCHLLLTALEGDELGALGDDLKRRYDVDVDTTPGDLTDAETRDRLVRWVGARERTPDIVVNNAGGGRFKAFAGSGVDEIERTIDLNVRVPVLLMHALIPLLRARPHAKIVNISSGIARVPYPGLATYGAAKGFVSSLSESIACELAETSVTVLCVHPGFTATRFLESADMDMSRVPRFLVGRPEKVASRILRAIRSDATWVYTDRVTPLGAILTALVPHRLRPALFRNLFWRVPDET